MTPKIEHKNVSIAQVEYNHLKRHALLYLSLGLLFMADPIYKIMTHYGDASNSTLTTLVLFYIPCIIYCGYSIIALTIDGWNLKGLKKGRGFNDEYSQHVIHKAQEIALACGIVGAGFFHLIPDKYLVVMVDDVPKTILALMALGYAIPTIFLLRDDNE